MVLNRNLKMANTLAKQPAKGHPTARSGTEAPNNSPVKRRAERDPAGRQREQEGDEARERATSAFYAGMKRPPEGTGFVLPAGLNGPRLLITDWVTGAPRARRAIDNTIADMSRAKRRKYFHKFGIELEGSGSSVEGRPVEDEEAQKEEMKDGAEVEVDGGGDRPGREY